MLRQSLSELCWFAERGHGARPREASYEMLAISGCFFPAFPDVSRAPRMLLAPLQLDAGTAVLPEDGVASQGGARDKGTWLAGRAGFKCLGCLYPGMGVAKMITHADQPAPHLTEDCKMQRQITAALHTATACACSSEPIGKGPLRLLV